MKRALKLLLSLALTVAFSWWAFRDTQWAQQWESLKSARLGWIGLYFLILTAIHLCRTLRWGCLLSGIERVPFRPLNEASGIGFMMLIVLPFRLGEFARPFLIAERSGIKRSAAMTTIVVERITDGLSIAFLLLLLMPFLPQGTQEARYLQLGVWATFAVFGGGAAFLLFSLWQRDRAVALVRRTLGRVWPRGADKAASVVDTFVGAMRQLPPPRQRILFFALTALYWGLNGLGVTLLSKAFSCAGASCAPLSLSLFAGYVVMGVLVVGVMIPAAPGMVGTFQAAVKLGLTLFLPAQVVSSTGIAFANVLWLCQTSQQILFGLVLMSTSQLSFRQLAGRLSADAEGAGASLSS